MKKTKITVKDVAKRAGVSQTTVSMILNGRRSFPEETCRRVIEACNELDYVRSGLFRSGEVDDKVLVAIVPTLSNFYFVHATEAMQRRAKELGYVLMVFETQRERTQESRIIQICNNFPFAGVIFCYPPENNMYLKQLEASKPVVHIYDKGIYDQENALIIDGLRVGKTIGRHLTDLGHEHIAYLCLDFEMKQVMRERRLEGLRLACKEKGLDAEKSVVLCTPGSELPQAKKPLDGYELGYLITKHLISRNSEITAIACLNDMIAIGAIDALTDMGKKVPEEYSVCGIDNTITSKYRGVSLTTVECYPTQVGKEAVDFIVRKIEQTDFCDETMDSPEGITQIEYFPKLIVRKTTGPVRKEKTDM